MSKCAKCRSELVEDFESKILRCSRCEEYHIDFATIIKLQNVWRKVLDKTNEILGKINVLLDVLPEEHANRIEVCSMYENLTTTVVKSLQPKIGEVFESLFPSFLVEASKRFVELSSLLEKNEINLIKILKNLPEEIYYDYKAVFTSNKLLKVEDINRALPIYLICISSCGKNLFNIICDEIENQEKIPEHDLIAGLFYAVRSFCEELLHHTIDNFKAGNYTIVFACGEIITDKCKKEKLDGYALIDNRESIDSETIEEIRQKIKEMLVKFSETFKGCNLETTSQFFPFESVIKEIFNKKVPIGCEINAK